jgi:hypothetical protein
MFVITIVSIMFAIFFEVQISNLTLGIFAILAVMYIAVSGKVSYKTLFNYSHYARMCERYNKDDVRFVMNLRWNSIIASVCALSFYAIKYFMDFELDACCIGFFVLTTCMYLKYLDAEYALKHENI